MNSNYIKLNEEQLKKLHGELLIILLELDRICKKYKIKYALGSGTLLGAVRHSGFIPWDDDVDVIMMRDEYEKFCNVCKDELKDSRLFLQTQKTDKNYNWVYGKLRLKDTAYIRAGQEHLKQRTGICIDILPIDKTKNTKYVQHILANISKICKTILWSSVGYKASNNKYKKIHYKLLSYIPRNIIIKIFEFIAKLYNNKETDYLVSYNVSCRVCNKSIHKDTLNMKFEGYELPVPVGYKQLLELYYGDYMKIPEPYKRKGSCDASYIKFSDGTELKI